jgi:hypothetical protein
MKVVLDSKPSLNNNSHLLESMPNAEKIFISKDKCRRGITGMGGG